MTRFNPCFMVSVSRQWFWNGPTSRMTLTVKYGKTDRCCVRRRTTEYYYYIIIILFALSWKSQGGEGIGAIEGQEGWGRARGGWTPCRWSMVNLSGRLASRGDGHSPISQGCKSFLDLFGYPFLKGSLCSPRNPNKSSIKRWVAWLRGIRYQCVKIQGALRAKPKFPFLVPTLILLRMGRITRHNRLIKTWYG
jgi:hypothetical protein